MRWRMSAAAFTLASSAWIAAAQTAPRPLAGVVSDQSGGVLPGVTVTATATTGATVTTVTAADGRFELPLAPGTYAVRADLAGFAPFSSPPIVVGSAAVDPLPIVLKIESYADTVVVTGSRSPEALRTAPVAVTVVRERELQTSPAAHYGDLLRGVPGLNAVELSARDIQLSTRAASGRNARTTLALLDGRTIYQDYFGMVLWDLLPVGFDEVRQVEVLRGPGSAIWGANALTGVINIITRSPREMVGTQGHLSIGERGTRSAGLVHAGVDGRLGYKVSGSFYSQDRWDRPAATPDGTALPPYTSKGTEQYKADARIDFDRTDRVKWRFDSGFASSSGLILVAVGPYDAAPLRQGYGSVEFTNGAASVTGSFTAHQARYQGLLTTDSSRIDSQSFQLDGKHLRAAGKHHVLVYGGSFKHSHFDLSFVPSVHRREEAGAFVTDDIFLNDRVRLTAGARVDWFDTFGASASPRLGIRVEPAAGQTIRATYNRAYVAPSLVENFAYFPASIELPLGTGPFRLPILTEGDSSLAPQTIDAGEVGYTALVGGATLSASAYRHRTRGLVTLLLAELYTPARPPPGWPLPPEVLQALVLPKTFRFSSVGIVDESGAELSADVPIGPRLAASANYSFQAAPGVRTRSGETPFPVNKPPRNRANVGMSFASPRFRASFSASFTDRAYWTDVLAIEGWTNSFWMLNGSAGATFARGRVTWMVKGTNLADRVIQQHVFGDLIRRRVTTEIRFKL